MKQQRRRRRLGRPREGKMDEIRPETGDYSQPIDSLPTLETAPGAVPWQK